MFSVTRLALGRFALQRSSAGPTAITLRALTARESPAGWLALASMVIASGLAGALALWRQRRTL